MPGSTGPFRISELRLGESPLDQSEYFVNRELARLAHNERTLDAAADSNLSPLERLKQLAIVSANVDQFFVTRIGDLKCRVGAGLRDGVIDRRSLRQIRECGDAVRDIELRQHTILRKLLGLLSERGVRIAHFDELSLDEQKLARDRFFERVYPLVTPQISDSTHPFPFVSNLSLNLLVSIRESPELPLTFARVKVPVGAGVPRFMQLRAKRVFVPLESVTAASLDLLFPGEIAVDCSLFRLTRLSHAEFAQGNGNGRQRRRFAPGVRLEVSTDMPKRHRSMLAAEFGLDEATDVFEVPEFHALGDLLEVVHAATPRAPRMRGIERAARLFDNANRGSERRPKGTPGNGSR
jgi:polyphosphate kinase